jgi:hypothetical protein
MSNIEEMEKLQAKSKFYLIPKEAKDGLQANLEIFPLGLDDMGLLSSKDDMDMNEMAENSKALMAASLKIPKENVKLDIKFMEEVMNAIMDLNGFDKEEMEKSSIKNFIDNKKSQLEENNGSAE